MRTHIPDGFLDLPICVIMYAISLVFWIPAFRKARRVLGEKHIPLMSMLTAGVFAAQMLNFPIVGGTSGHLVGGTLIAIFLGPYAAIICITIILVIQALLFGDGGLTALGANVFNMGIVAALSYYVYIAVTRIISGRRGVLTGAFIASWFAVVAGAVSCGIEVGLSSTFQPYGGIVTTVPAMAFWHVIIGVGEALITMSILAYTLKVKPNLLELRKIMPGWRERCGKLG